MTVEDQLNRMAAVLCFGGMWHARAEGCRTFATAPTVAGAMSLALLMLDCDSLPDGDALPNDDLF